MKAFFARLRHVMQNHLLENALHKGHETAHLAYLALVSVEAHGYYGKAALVLLIIAGVMHFAGMGVSDD